MNKVEFNKDESINLMSIIEDCVERGMFDSNDGILKAMDTIKKVDQLISDKGYNGTNVKITIEFGEIVPPSVHDEDWIDIYENPPKDNEEVYLKCTYMFAIYVTKGTMIMTDKGLARGSADCDMDMFMRSGVLAWKPIEEVK